MILALLVAIDAVSPMTAAGVEKPDGLDWAPEVRAQPAAKTFKNVKVLGDVPSERFMAAMHAMQSMRANLDVKCLHCHDVEGKNFASDEKKAKVRARETPKKQRAREMLAMVSIVARDYYGGNTPVACGMCHRGSPTPAIRPK